MERRDQPNMKESKTARYFEGTHSRKLEANCRIVVPKAWADLLGETAHLVMGKDGKLSVWPHHYWEEQADQVKAVQMGQNDKSEARDFFSQSTPLIIKHQDRFVIPKEERHRAHLENTDIVVLVACGACFEIWAKDQWDAREGTSD